MNKVKEKNISIFKERLNKLDVICLELIGEEFSAERKYKLKDNDNYLYNLSSTNLGSIIRRNGTMAKFFNYNPYTYENINNYFKLNNIDVELINKNPKKATERIEFKCLKHNEIFLRAWNVILHGSVGCGSCTGITNYTYKMICDLVKEKGVKFISPTYHKVHQDYEFKCSCGKKFIRRMDVFLYQNVTKCNSCFGITVNTYEGIRSELEHYGIELLSDIYKNNITNLKIKYPCGFVTERNIENIRRGNYQCPHCSKKGYKRDTERFYNEVRELVGNEYTFEGEYTICDAKMWVTHNVCKHRYQTTPHRFINAGARCPICVNSKSEASIAKHLKGKDIDFIPQYTFDELVGIKGGLLRFDFALKNKNNRLFLIEYDGEYHYEPIEGEERLKIQQEHDRRKDEYCKNNNIKLYRIPYWENDNLINIIEGILYEEGLHGQS